MKRIWLSTVLSSALLVPATARAQEGAAPSAPPPPAAAPAPTQATPQGQWIYTDAYGWVWVPAGAVVYNVQAEPYVYLYTPSFGWTWYVSPWGWGPFYVGPWVHRPWGVARVWHGGHWVGPRGHVRVVGPRYAPTPRAYGGARFHAGGAHFHGGGHFHGGHR